MSEIDRMPASVIRRAIQAGVGAVGSTPETTSAVNTGHPSGSSTRTG